MLQADSCLRLCAVFVVEYFGIVSALLDSEATRFGGAGGHRDGRPGLSLSGRYPGPETTVVNDRLDRASPSAHTSPGWWADHSR